MLARVYAEESVSQASQFYGVSPPKVRLNNKLYYDYNYEGNYYISPAWIERRVVYISIPAIAFIGPVSTAKTICHEVSHVAYEDTGLDSIVSYLLFGTDEHNSVECERCARRILGKARQFHRHAKRYVELSGVLVPKKKSRDSLREYIRALKLRGLAELVQLTPIH